MFSSYALYSLIKLIYLLLVATEQLVLTYNHKLLYNPNDVFIEIVLLTLCLFSFRGDTYGGDIWCSSYAIYKLNIRITKL